MTYKELYRAEQLPIFQNRMFPSPEAARNCTKGDMILVQDLNTGLIFNQAFQPDLMIYDGDYQNEQSLSLVFQNHLLQVTQIIHRHLQDQTLIEIGCGKGYFLEQLQAQGFQVTGLDPTYEGNNPHILKTHFIPGMGLKADGIILRHVLEHIHHPVEFLQMLREANQGGGQIYIEVPCFDWICEHRAWFDLFYEHVNYFRLDDFYRIFDHIDEIGHLFGGQYLYVVADLATVHPPDPDSVVTFEFPENFLAPLHRTLSSHSSSSEARGSHRDKIIWGGASKGVIFALFMQRAGIHIDWVIDINPGKQGKFLPATGLKVYSPQEALAQANPGSTIYVMNGNYLDEIQQIASDQFTYVVVDHG